MNARAWLAVASAEHVGRGRTEGFMQVCHGKRAPLMRVCPGDGVVYYSPTTRLRGGDRLQAFTAIGRVGAGEPYAYDMGGGFVPHRRRVDWWDAQQTPIRPLLDDLALTADRPNWGYQLRSGLLPLAQEDFETIARAMRAQVAVAPGARGMLEPSRVMLVRCSP